MATRVLIGLPFLWLAVFFLLPLAIVAGISFTESADAIPPFTPLSLCQRPASRPTRPLPITANSPRAALPRLSEFARQCRRSRPFLCLLIGYPIAFAIARAPGAWRNLLLFLVILPFWTSFLIRVYAWIATAAAERPDQSAAPRGGA